jgi:chromosome segregation protein
MKLLRMHLQGFKSFKDKTTINFDDGITGIVGPNGCGKSNIVDALFWVMGEQSAKHLRGKKMADLIFAGSSKYSPGSFAEVTLIMSNETGKHIHIGSEVSKPTEIQLTRKLYRNGETEYKINGTQARLKDIQEVFMDTGAGAKSYSIIAQGEINKLVQAKPVERRTMIEEVAGITKFKLRKKESLRKIENTEMNLSRLQDLQNEIYKNLKSLERQSEKAERARTLKGRIERHDLIYSSNKEHDFLKDYKEGQLLLAEKRKALEIDSINKEEIELALEDERNKKSDLTDKVELAQEEFNEISKTLAAAQERLNYLKKSKDEKILYTEQRAEENGEIQSDILKRDERRQELDISLTDLEQSNPEQMDLADLEDKASTLKEQTSSIEEEKNELKIQLDQYKDDLANASQSVFRNESELTRFSKDLEDIALEIETLEEVTSSFSRELSDKRERKLALESEVGELHTEMSALKERKVELQDNFDAQDAEVRVLSKEVITHESKLQSLQAIAADLEGGAADFLENNDSGFQIFGKLIECQGDYGRALENLFSDYFTSLVSNRDLELDEIKWCLDNNEISLDILNVSENNDFSETLERLQVNGVKAISVEEIAKINDSNFKNIADFFKGFYIAEELNEELITKVASKINFKGIINKDATIIIKKSHGSVFISKRSEESSAMGVVQRNNMMTDLSESLEVQTKELNELEETMAANTAELSEVKINLETVTEDYNTKNNEFVSIRAGLESQEGTHKTNDSRLEILVNRKNQISKSRLELLENEEGFSTKKEDLQEVISDREQSLSDLNERFIDVKSNYDEVKDELLEKQASAKSYDSQKESIQSQINDIATQIERYNEKIATNVEKLSKLNEEIDTIELSVEELSVSNTEQESELTDQKESLSLIKDSLADLLSNMQDREREVKDITSNMNKNDKRIVEVDLKMKQIIEDEALLVRDTFEKYQVDLREILSIHLELGEDLSEDLQDISSVFIMETDEGEVTVEKVEYLFEKRFPGQVRESRDKYKQYRKELNRLGDINWQAIEDYDKQKRRHDFLKEQEEELKKSLTDLETAIEHIDIKSRSRFTEAYNEVNVRFEKVFPIIFGGGEARLQITGDLNDPECGIEIIAQPPGKKMQNINLMSGGEKAMTAVSLIFSIFLVKPSPFCLLDEVDAPLDDANVGRFNELLREMSTDSQFILITHNKKTMELNDSLYGVTMQEPGVSKAVSVQLH